MADILESQELRSPFESIKSWLSARQTNSNIDDVVTVQAPESLRKLGLLDLFGHRFGQQHQDQVTSSINFETQKPHIWTELSHLTAWANELHTSIAKNKSTIALLDLLKGGNDYAISKAKYHVDECLTILESAINFEISFDISHPDTRSNNYAVNNILIDDSTLLTDIVGQIFASLIAKCLIRLVVKSNQFFSAILVSFIVDLMYLSGATGDEVRLLILDRRDSLGTEMKFIKSLYSRKNSKLSIIAAVFKDTDTFAAAQGIAELYFRELYPNMIILVEESSYERFVKDWQRYYSHALSIGSRLDVRTSVVDSFNEKVTIDLCAIDIKKSHKMSGNVLNVLRFRNLAEMMSLLTNLRKVPIMSLWNDDLALLRDLSSRINICQEFWLNHIPITTSGYQFPDVITDIFGDAMAPDMADLYNNTANEYSEEINQVRKLQVQFLKKKPRLRTSLIMQAYNSLITKNKSYRHGLSPSEAMANLRRFQSLALNNITLTDPGHSHIETLRRPVGLAIILIREEMTVKSRPILVDFIFKNLLVGNGVLLVCPHNNLGAKIVLENDHVIPFKIAFESVPDVSRLSLNPDHSDSLETSQQYSAKKQCPSNTYVVEMTSELTYEMCHSYTLSLGTRTKRIWSASADVTNYWSTE